MSPNEFDPRTLIAESRIGILATIKSNGVPQLSLVTAVYDSEADIIYVSMTDGRAKTANLRRDRGRRSSSPAPTDTPGRPRKAKYLIGPGDDPDGPEADALVDYYRRGAGEHPDWQEYRQVMVDDRRVLMVLHVTRVYGAKLR